MDSPMMPFPAVIAASVSGAGILGCVAALVMCRHRQHLARMANGGDMAWAAHPVSPDSTGTVAARYAPLMRHQSNEAFLSPPSVLSHRHAAMAAGSADTSEIRLFLANDEFDAGGSPAEPWSTPPSSAEAAERALDAAVPAVIPWAQLRLDERAPAAVGVFARA